MRLLFIALFALLMVSFVSAQSAINLQPITAVNGNPGSTVSYTLNVTNTGGTAISTINLVSTTLTSGSNTIAAPSITPITSLAAGASGAQTLTFTIPSVPAGAYTGTITATDASNGTNTDTESYSLTVNTVDAFSITQDSVTVTGEERDTKTATFNINNNGSTSLAFIASDFSFPQSTFTDNDGDNLTITFTSLPTIAPGANGQGTINVVYGDNIDVGRYSGTVTVRRGSGTDTFLLDIRVQPEVCEDGPVGNIRLRVENPDNNDDFAPGDTMDIEVEVENNDDEELDIGVEAFLYNVNEDDEVERVESESEAINDGDDQTFELSFKIPLNDISENDEYILFVKAFEDGDEDQNCAEDSVNIDIERERHDVRVDSLTINPSLVSCGELVNSIANVINVGSSREDVTVEIKNPELGLSQVSPEFELDDGEDTDNDAVRRFSFTIPQDAQEQEYNIEAIVTFDDEQNSLFQTLTVQRCGEIAEEAAEETAIATLRVNQADITGDSAKGFSIPVTINNEGLIQQSFTVEVVNADWAEPVTAQTLTLNSGQSSTVYLYLKPSKDIMGKQSAIVNLKSGSNILATQSLSFDLGEEKKLLSGITGATTGIADSNVFWIIGDVVLVVVAIFFLRMLFRKR